MDGLATSGLADVEPLCFKNPIWIKRDLAQDLVSIELWESKFDGLLSLVKEYIIDVWEIRKH